MVAVARPLQRHGTPARPNRRATVASCIVARSPRTGTPFTLAPSGRLGCLRAPGGAGFSLSAPDRLLGPFGTGGHTGLSRLFNRASFELTLIIFFKKQWIIY